MAKRLTYKEVKEFIEEKGCKLISKEYKNGKEKLEIECKCGNHFLCNLKNFKSSKKYNCPRCSYHSLTYEEVKLDIEKHGSKLISSEYVNNETKIEIECDCGNKFKAMYRDIKASNRYKCPKCNNRPTFTYKEVEDFIESKGCKLISEEYVNNMSPLNIECKCGRRFNRKFNTFKDGKSYYCKHCSNGSSKGEDEIEEYLIENNITYETQKRFDGCKFKRKLPFDFAIFENNKLKCLIEYDGRQHYEIVKAFGGLDGFIGTKIRDTVKNEYCKNNNIKLIRIPYTELKNIKSILRQVNTEVS